MEYKDIKHKRLLFKHLEGPRYVTSFQGHEIGIHLGDFPPDHLYNVFIDQQQVHSSDSLPSNWKLEHPE